MEKPQLPVLNGRAEPDTLYPTSQNDTSTIQRGGFVIRTRKMPILKAEPIEQMERRLGITVPEMIFGDNMVVIEHPSTQWSITFDAFGALDRVDKTGESMLQVAHSEEWQQSRRDQHESINRVVKPFDWSYSTDFKGRLSDHAISFQSSTTSIPLERLKRPDPILFFDEVMLYEDEMADNGITMYSCKIRVMPECLLLLARFFMRLDHVLFRVRDTRVFVDFASKNIIREYCAKEEVYQTVQTTLASRGFDVLAKMRDPNAVAEVLPIKEQSLECVQLAAG